MNAHATPQAFMVLQGASCSALPSKAYNEDAFGWQSQRLWVIDGATGVSPVQCTRHASDAAWLATAAHDCLASMAATPVPMGDLLNSVQSTLRASFAQETTSAGTAHELPEPAHLPSACLGMVQWFEGFLEIACVGDVTIAVHTPGQPLQFFSDTASNSCAQRTMAAWQNARDSGIDLAHRWEQVRPVILENRQAMNTSGGYRVMHPVLSWTSGLPVTRIAAAPGTRVMLASDGFWRLVDLYFTYSPLALMDAVENHGADALLSELRAIEAGDMECAHYARIKPCDDATVVLAELGANTGEARP